MAQIIVNRVLRYDKQKLRRIKERTNNVGELQRLHATLTTTKCTITSTNLKNNNHQ